MPTIQELVQLVAEGDEEAQEQLNAALAQLQQGKMSAERELKLKTDKALRDRYPRALRAFDRGKLSFAADMDDNAVESLLREREEEYAELGVPIENVVETPAAQAPQTPVETDDPAQALAGVGGSSGPGGMPRDQVYEYLELAVKGTTEHDRARANRMLIDLQHLPGGQEKIQQIVQALEAPPITLKGI